MRRVVPALALAALPALALHGLVLGTLPLGSAQAARTEALPLQIRAVLVDAAPAPVPVVAADAAPTEPAPRSGWQDRQGPAAPPAVRQPSRRTAPAPLPVTEAATGSRTEALAVDAADAAGPAHDIPHATPIDSLELPAAVADTLPLPEAAVEEAPLLLAAAAPARGEKAKPVADDDSVDPASVPVYKTAVPPSQTLRYNLKRGMLSGNGELRWQRDAPGQPGAKYELQLEARIGNMVLLTQVSSGGFDSAGLAPVRFTDRRLRSSARAANFQRQRALITFSGPSTEYPLLRGSQDRLSWMMQLPAILSATPRLASTGEKVTLYVVGSRGDAAIWDFRYIARERVSTDDGPVDAVKFVREPRKPHDTTAEVWLDPSQHYLPVRARIGNPEDGPMLELVRVGA